MFGLYRTLLALLVVWQHLLGSWLPIGKYAVHGFFILSGYLMTYVMHQSYGFDSKGRKAFAANRALRLYPSYFAVALLAVVILSYFPGPVFRPSMGIPETLAQWLQNLTMVYVWPMPNMVSPRLSPATWALTIELFYYAAICIGVSKSKLLTWIWFAAGVVYHVTINILDAASGYAYMHILSGSLPFSIGALIYHYPPRLPRLSSTLVATLGTLAIVGIAVISDRVPTFYVNMIINAAIIAFMVKAVGDRKRDKFVCDFSYHIYIMHWPVGLAVYSLLGFTGPNPDLLPFAATIAACLLISLALTNFIDLPVEQWRKRLRKSVGDGDAFPARGLSS